MEERKPATAPHGAAPPSSAPSAASPSMTAPSIPNLLSRLGSGPPRAGRGGRRGFGRAGTRGGLQSSYGGSQHHGGHGGHGGTTTTLDRNGIIQSTDTDAAISRLSAVDIGLLDDPFAKFFAGDGGPAPRRLPIINRGTYTRTHALDTIIRAFLSDSSSSLGSHHSTAAAAPRQIVSLGAGTDTRSLRLLSQRENTYHNVIYHEIDFPAVCAKKRSILQSVPYLRSLLQSDITEHGTFPESGNETDKSNIAAEGSWHVDLGGGNELWGHGLDLRQLATERGKAVGSPSTGNSALAGLRTDVPTLLVSECCLCYLQPPDAVAVLRWFADRFTPASAALGVVIYEPIRPNDAFGRTMVANLAARGIEMPTLVAYPDGATQESRLRHEAGLDQTRHCTIDAIWDQWVSEEEQERVNQLDGLDEVEEWKLLASHYVVVWGSRGAYFKAAWAQLYQS